MSTYPWLYIKNSKVFSPLFENTVSEIKLRQSIDSIQWAVFSDADLTAKWLEYLEQLRVRLLSSLDSQNETNGGGGQVVELRIGNLIFTLIFIDMRHLKYNDHIYEMKSELNCPFEETYDISIKRNGFVTPWS